MVFLDTGAGTSVISAASWPTNWKKNITITQLQGIGWSQRLTQSSILLQWEDKTGNAGAYRPYILAALLVNLWRHDILTQVGALMHSPNKTVTINILQQGHLPGKGLGKQQQSITSPVTLTVNHDQRGLGFL